MDRLKNLVGIVRGGALGIGRATSRLFAREGALVAVTDMDVTKEKEVQDVFSKIRNRFGKIDVLVNNAGISGVNKPTHEVSEEEWDKLMGVNVKGVFLCTKHAIPYMKGAGGGSVINLSSIYGIVMPPRVRYGS